MSGFRYATQNGEPIGQNQRLLLCHGKGITLKMQLFFLSVLLEKIYLLVHIEEMVDVRETKRGAEELTADIPNVVKKQPKILMKME